MTDGIVGINLIFGDGESLFVEHSYFSHLYVANLDDQANEIPYRVLFKTNKLFANFFSLRINHLLNDMQNMNVLKAAFNKKNLLEIELVFRERTISFYLASDIDPFKEHSINSHEKSFFEDNDLCLLVCPYNLKYKNHLFA